MDDSARGPAGTGELTGLRLASRTRTRRRLWLLASATLALAGIAASLAVALALARNDAQQSRAALRLTANEVADNTQAGLDQQEALLLAEGAFFRRAPKTSQAQFRAWIRDVQAFNRYPGLIGSGEIALVPRRRLAKFLAEVDAQHLNGSTQEQIFPPGSRPYYCLPRVADYTIAIPPGIDGCALSPLLIHSRDTGIPIKSLVGLGPGVQFFATSDPLYRGAAIPSTIAARRRLFLGWAVLIVNPRLFLTSAIASHPGYAVTMRNAGVSFSAGRAPAGAGHALVSLPGHTTVEVLGAVHSASITADGNALEVMVGGTLLSLVLACLLFVLATSRARAMRLVAEKTEELSFQALHDPLTELPNRALMLDRITHALARTSRSQAPCAVLFIDIDSFKAINDTLGHAAGDELLRIVAGRLVEVVREEDTVGRMGGDEFVVLLESSELYTAPELVAERVLEVLAQPVSLGQAQQTLVSASIGIAAGTGDSAEDVLRNADLALYAAKSAGRNQFATFEDEMQHAASDRYELETDLLEAVRRDELFLVYQPTFDLRTGVATGVEALVRWQHPTRGVVAPADFIPVAEKSGQIIEIGRWVLREACEQAARWLAEGYAATISVNVSARQLEDPELVDDVEQALFDAGLDASRLTLEITETLLMSDPDASAARLQVLKDLGVKIAIDDFGTGYSSLAYLQQFPVDALKIDRAFISGISATGEATALMHTLVQLGKMLGLETLGEGIEEPEQLAGLRAEDCDLGQGFLLGRPLPAGSVEQFLVRDDALSGSGAAERRPS